MVASLRHDGALPRRRGLDGHEGRAYRHSGGGPRRGPRNQGENG
jgi:hypothetical protein